jgi:hypothetical protein
MDNLYDDFEDGSSSLASIVYGFQSQSQASKPINFFDFVEIYFGLNLTHDSDIINACQL